MTAAGSRACPDHVLTHRRHTSLISCKRFSLFLSRLTVAHDRHASPIRFVKPHSSRPMVVWTMLGALSFGFLMVPD
jgi:hypothetical protein